MKALTRFFHLTSTLMIFFFPLFVYAGSPASAIPSSAPATGQISVKAPLDTSKQNAKHPYQKKDKYQNKEKGYRKEADKRCLANENFQSHPVFDTHGQLIRHEYLDSKGMLRILIVFKGECGCWHETRFDENGRIISEGEYASMPVYEKQDDSNSAKEESESDEDSDEGKGGSSSVSGSAASASDPDGSFASSGIQTADKFTQYQYGSKGTLVKIIVRYPGKHMQCEYNRKGALKVLVIFSPGKNVMDRYDFQNGKPIRHTCLNHNGETLHEPEGSKPGHAVLIHSVPVRISVNIHLTVYSGMHPSKNMDDMTPRSTAAVPTEAQENRYYNYYDRRPVGNFRHERVEESRYTQGRGNSREDVRDRWERVQRTEIYERSAVAVNLKDVSLSWKEMLQSRFSSEISDFQSMKEVLGKGDINGKKPFKDTVLEGNSEKNHNANAFKEQVKETGVQGKSEKISLKSRSLKEKVERPFKGQNKAFSKPGILSHKADALKEKEPQMQHKTDTAPVKLPPAAKMIMKK